MPKTGKRNIACSEFRAGDLWTNLMNGGRVCVWASMAPQDHELKPPKFATESASSTVIRGAEPRVHAASVCHGNTACARTSKDTVPWVVVLHGNTRARLILIRGTTSGCGYITIDCAARLILMGYASQDVEERYPTCRAAGRVTRVRVSDCIRVSTTSVGIYEYHTFGEAVHDCAAHKVSYEFLVNHLLIILVLIVIW